MDRQIVYAGSIPLDTDLLNIQRYIMTSIGALAQAILGTTGLADGFPCAGGPDAYTVLVGPGSFTGQTATDGAAFGSLPADATPLMQTALHLDTTTLQLGPPPSSDQSICWLIQLALTGIDTSPLALPYWNAANPAVAFSGPGNSGNAQNTQRLLRVTLSCKPSNPEPAVTGLPPAPDAGFVGLYAVTTYAGKPSIEAADIVAIGNSPTLRYKLPMLPPGATRQETFSSNTFWRAPPGVQNTRVRLVAGGGGGGGGDTNYSGGGGGAGGYSEVFQAVIPGQYYQVTIGVGGVGGSPGVTGGAGGDTDFGGLVHATGGLGGGANNPDSHGGGPGRGVTGGLVTVGGWGGDGAALALIPGGNGGVGAFGGGGRGANEGGIPAIGQAAGSGGGGGYGVTSYGGAGANGLIILDY